MCYGVGTHQRAAMNRTLHIITGPPGSGKTTHAATDSVLKRLPVYDCDLGNKDEWRTSAVDCVLLTAAPNFSNKEYWVSQALKGGFLPILTTLCVPRMVSLQRMSNRSGLTPTEKNNLNAGVEQWYKRYSRHPQEIRLGSF